MANQVTILNGYNITPPFSGIACDVYGNQCQYVGSGNTFPVTFILPLQFKDNVNRKNLNLIGSELISILNIEKGLNPSDHVDIEIKHLSGELKKIKMLCRIDTKNELEYYKNGGILQYVLRKMI